MSISGADSEAKTLVMVTSCGITPIMLLWIQLECFPFTLFLILHMCICIVFDFGIWNWAFHLVSFPTTHFNIDFLMVMPQWIFQQITINIKVISHFCSRTTNSFFSLSSMVSWWNSHFLLYACPELMFRRFYLGTDYFLKVIQTPLIIDIRPAIWPVPKIFICGLKKQSANTDVRAGIL